VPDDVEVQFAHQTAGRAEGHDLPDQIAYWAGAADSNYRERRPHAIWKVDVDVPGPVACG
jgi:hypothetical protein